MLNTRDVAFRLVQIEAEVLHAKAAAVLYRQGDDAALNVQLRAYLLALRNRVNMLCDEVLTGDETRLFLADVRLESKKAANDV